MLAEIISFLNIVADIYIDVYNAGKKAVIAGVNSQKPDTWVFLMRNSLPWVVKNFVENTYSYSPLAGIFFIGDEVANKKLDDLVIAEILDSSGTLVLDISETMHKISWNSAPSLYEMILVSLLTKDILIREEIMRTYNLSITTIDSPDLNIPLTHDLIKEPFTNWSVYA